MTLRLVPSANLAEGFPDRRLRIFLDEDFQQHSLRGRLQFIAHFFGFEPHDRLSSADRFSLALQPANHVGLGGGNAASLRNFKSGNNS